MKFIRNWERDLMSTAIKKDFKCSWRRVVSPSKENCHFILIIMARKCLLNIVLILYAKMI